MNDDFLTNFAKYIAAQAAPTITKAHGVEFSNRELNLIKPPRPSALQVRTLTAIVNYLQYDIDKTATDADKVFIHVVDFDAVNVAGYLDPNHMTRRHFVKAVYPGPVVDLGPFTSLDRFLPLVQTLFMDGGDKANLLKVAGNVTSKAQVTVKDDGITQETQARAGIARIEDIELPSTVTLIPFTTFPEIEQPERKYAFRMERRHDEVRAALIPADGEVWKMEAIKRIAKYLNEKTDAEVIF